MVTRISISNGGCILGFISQGVNLEQSQAGDNRDISKHAEDCVGIASESWRSEGSEGRDEIKWWRTG